MSEEAASGLITIEQAARLLMLGDERVRQLCKQGFIPKPAKNRVPLVGAVQGYIKFLKEEERRSSKSAAASRVSDARAREVELRIAERERKLIDFDDATGIVDLVVGAYRTRFGGLAARVTRDLALRRKIQDEVDDTQRAVSATLDETIAAIRAGRDPFAPDDEDGAGSVGAENRVYPATAGVPGPRDPGLTPYMIAFGRAIAEGRYRRAVMACSAQIGKSETLLDVMGERLDRAPAPILYVGPSKQFLTEQFEPRIMALLDEAPTLKGKVARGKRMTKTRKLIAGVPLRLAHAGSSTALKSDPAALAMTDEADELMANVKGQGDPIALIDRRGETYSDFVHAIVSTPSEGPSDVRVDEESGLEFWDEQDTREIGSAIWRLWQEGTRFHWAWPCPHCEEYFVPRFRCLQWPKGATASSARQSAFVACPRCGGVIQESDKAGMNARGVYVAPGQRVEKDGTVIGVPPESITVSFWVSGLASPFRTFGDRAAEHIEAVRSGDLAKVQAVINGGFGELWAPSGGEAPEWAELSRKSQGSTYERGQVPDKVLHLTLAADVQKSAIFWSIRGWGPRATSWLIELGRLHGDTAEEEIWTDLADIVTTPVDGLPIRLAFVDSGFRPGKTDTLPINRVYEFCRRFPRQVRPTKGSSSQMRTPLITSKIEVTRAGKQAPYGLELVRLDTDHWKSWVHERIRWPEDQIGAWHLPHDVDEDYAKQIVSESRIKRPSGRVQWVQRSRDNHYLDVEAMHAAAGYMLNVQRIGETARRPAVPAEAPLPPPQRPNTFLPRQRGWLSR